MSDSGETSDYSRPSFNSSDENEVENLLRFGFEKSLLPDFELHFDLSAQSVRAVLLQIVEDLSSHKQLHSWDEKLVTSPLRLLRAAVHRYIGANVDSNMNILLFQANVHEISTVDGVNKTWPAFQESDDIYNQLFLSRCLRSHIARRPNLAQHDSAGNQNLRKESFITLPFAHGRIVNIKEQNTSLQRAALLALHTFCLQLQNENHGFIQEFVERHLALRSTFKAPDRLQPISLKETEFSGNKFYKRVTLSSHIAYLSLDSSCTSDKDKPPIDRLFLGPFRPKKSSHQVPELHLFKKSCSVMLTLVVPEESLLNEEEIKLIERPCALWTVLIANGTSRFSLDSEPAEHLSPCAQFLRGVTASLSMQRTNAQHMIQTLNDYLEAHDDENLFDDEEFTKSGMYHWAILICHELSGSLALNLEHIEKVLNGEVKSIIGKAHAHEKLGLSYWFKKMNEETKELERLQMEVNMLREKVQEHRSALHGATAVLEARSAIRQGERVQTLTYLATAYLPLTTVASFYSMAVLPPSATLGSFFVALLIAFAITFLLGINLFKLRGIILQGLQSPKAWVQGFLAPFHWMRDRARSYAEELQTENTKLDLSILCGPRDIRSQLISIIRDILLPEINLPLVLVAMFLYRHNRFVEFTWNPILLVAHMIRIALIPVWMVLAIVTMCGLVITDCLLECGRLVSRWLNSG